ncbi:MAG: NAD(P)H-binding protein [Actinobacteria bacterium]|nr:NAD(P)H-binding protein [Actinomycetota bacterium]
MRVTVFGATGVVGQALLPLLAEKHEVVAVSRGARDPDVGIRWVEADVASGEGVGDALEGAAVAYYLVHSLGARDFERRDREAAGNVAREAARAGIEQIVYLGGLGGDDRDASPHLRSRRETGAHLASHGVPVTTLRAAMVVGKGSAAFETILGLVRRLPVMITPNWVSTPTQPIALTDVVRYLAGVAGNDAAIGQPFDVGGPEVMTYRQMIERIAALLGKRPRIIEVPVLTPALSALWLELVTPVNALVARPLVEGLRNPTVAREERLRKLLPFELTSFDEAARHAFDA